MAIISPEIQAALRKAADGVGEVAHGAGMRFAQLAGDAVTEFGQKVIAPVAEAVDNDLREHPLTERVDEAIAGLRRWASDVVKQASTPRPQRPVAQRVRIEQ